jgi:hypothetical protein
MLHVFDVSRTDKAVGHKRDQVRKLGCELEAADNVALFLLARWLCPTHIFVADKFVGTFQE